MNLVTIDTSPGNMSMYIAPNNTSYLQIGANASMIQIGPLNQNTNAPNVSTVINGVRIDSNMTNQNLIVTLSSNPYSVNNYPLTNTNNTMVSNIGFSVNMSGSYCTAVGQNCLTNNTTGVRNDAFGSGTAQNITTGSYNTALGSRALLSAISNSSNVAVGYEALMTSATSRFPSVAVGVQSLLNVNNSLGGANVAVGHQALLSLTTGIGNVAIGYKADGGNQDMGGAHLGNTIGTNNIVIGNQANCQGCSSSVLIGANANTSSVASNCVLLGHNTNSNYQRCVVLGSDAGANANDQIIIGPAGGAHTTWIQGSGGLNVPIGPASLANTTINKTVGDKAGQIILNKNEYSNNTIAYDATGGVIDYITTTDDKFGPTGNNSFAKAIMIKGANLNFSSSVDPTEWNKTGNGGNVLIRGGGSFSIGNNGTASQTLNGGNIYIDSGTAACGGEVSNAVIANPGSIYLRCGRKTSGYTYYTNIYDDKMTISPTLISTTVPMTIFQAVGTGTITGTQDTMSSTAGSLIIKHDNPGGGSSIVFPSRTDSTDFGYIRYRDDVNNAVAGAERSRLEIGVQNDFGAAGSGSINDCLVLNKNGGNVGIGTSNPDYTLDVSGTARVNNLTLSSNITLPTTYIAPTSEQLGGITKGVFLENTLFMSAGWVSTPSFTLLPGNYILSIYLRPKARFFSPVTFESGIITITDSSLNTGTERFVAIDKFTQSANSALSQIVFSFSNVFINDVTRTLYLNFFPEFTKSDGLNPYLNETDGVSFMRIA